MKIICSVELIDFNRYVELYINSVDAVEENKHGCIENGFFNWRLTPSGEHGHPLVTLPIDVFKALSEYTGLRYGHSLTPSKENLPQHNEPVLGLISQDDNGYKIVKFDPEKGWVLSSSGEYAGTVTHWIPLPIVDDA